MRKQHKHWPHVVLCLVLCAVLHFILEWISYDRTSVYIADLQNQIDTLENRFDRAQGIVVPSDSLEWDR